MRRLARCRARWCSDRSAQWQARSSALRQDLPSRTHGECGGLRRARESSEHRKRAMRRRCKPRAIFLRRRRPSSKQLPRLRPQPSRRRFRVLNRSSDRPLLKTLAAPGKSLAKVTIATSRDGKPAAGCFQSRRRGVALSAGINRRDHVFEAVDRDWIGNDSRFESAVVVDNFDPGFGAQIGFDSSK